MAAMPAIDGMDMPCECCGVTASQAYEAQMHRTFKLTSNSDETTFLCDFCEGLITAGLLQREIHDGEVRYRQWRMEWTPGELLDGPHRPAVVAR